MVAKSPGIRACLPVFDVNSGEDPGETEYRELSITRFDFLRKSCMLQTPATAGTSAAGICGSLAFAQCCSPFGSMYWWIWVRNACSTCASTPENSITLRPFETRLI